MRISKRVLMLTLAVVLTCLAVSAAFVPQASACLPSGVYRYYSTAAHLVQVGQKTVACPCKVTMTGTTSPYVVYTASGCIEP
jgi:hypothetical protein